MLLVLMSVGLVGTWVYHLYDKNAYSQRRTEVYIKDSTAVAQAVTDSLQRMYSSAITDLGTQLNFSQSSADSLKSQLAGKVQQINTLKSEITGILNKKGVTKEELSIAREKIAELQEKIDELRNQNSSIEEEKKRLTSMLDGMTTEITGLQENMKRLDEENKALSEKVTLGSTFVASEIKLTPVTFKNDKEEETTQAKKANKLIVSFAVQNNVTDYSSTDLYLVITQPDGQVFRNDVWESGTFDIKGESKKAYTQKMHFEYLKGEPKRFQFSMNPDSYQPGTYTMQLYHNGSMVGKTSKTLN
jgi:hypothetical protein